MMQCRTGDTPEEIRSPAGSEYNSAWQRLHSPLKRDDRPTSELMNSEHPFNE